MVGDWDGDGKSDAGVFSLGGGADRALVLADAGLPDPMNQVTTDASRAHLAPLPGRQFVLHRTALSAPRRETIDHVLQFGSAGDLPVAGDWNGSGITKIGVFRGGRWTLDQNGDGRFGSEDPTHSFGPHDSLPLAGDFDGDGVFELAVFRDGWWRVDVDGDHSSGDGDLVVQFGAPSGTPLVADIDGDGVHELGVFHAEQE